MKRVFLVLFLFIAVLSTPKLFAQSNNVGIGTTTPDATAILDITSTSKGVLVPRLTTAQRTAITTPSQGLLVYDTDLGCFYYYNSTTSAWVSLCQAGPAGSAGPQGPTGANGAAGATGPSGIDGAAGAAGAAGAPGAPGSPGAAGPAGANGANGAQGPQGPTGSTGPGGIGSVGPTGPQGVTGPTGTAGVTGPQGNVGATGTAGAAGPTGSQGNIGATGTVGVTGPTGANGFVSSNIVTLTSGGANPTVLSAPTGANVVYTQLPNLTYTVTVPTASKFVILAFGSASKATNTSGITSYAQYAVFLDGVNTNTLERIGVDINTDGLDYEEVPWAISTVVSVAAGSHTVSIQGAHAGPTGSDKIWICTPAGFVGQAQMSVLITQ